MSDNIKLNVVGRVTATTDVVPDGSTAGSEYETMTPPTSPVDDIYESVSPRQTPEPMVDPQGYLVPTYPVDQKGSKTSSQKSNSESRTGWKLLSFSGNYFTPSTLYQTTGTSLSRLKPTGLCFWALQ
jgi:hypothetical protein